MTDAGANAGRGYTITRIFDAPRELVWKAWTEPENFAQWFGGSEARMESMAMDVRPGGSWSTTELVVRQSVGHLTDEEYGHAKEGTSIFLDAMAELLTRL
ncbi:MAG: hypothetical protein QOG53_170 [Frankiales bacterium]|jgi:uncharacterized protein YndB with AHSA1/START domain|nr:hypothetical protein [Frankiales bacterium]